MSAGIPLRLEILTALTALVETISPINGYINDLSIAGSVVRGRLLIGDSEVLPMVAFNEPPMAIEPLPAASQNPSRDTSWDILIQGWIDDDPAHPCDAAYVLAAEVGQIIALEKTKPSGRPGQGNGPNFFGFGPKIIDLRIGAPVVRPPDTTSKTACFYQMLTLQIVEDMTKPFG
jgi:hypothetical protein